MTGGEASAAALPAWGFRVSAPRGGLPLGAVFGAVGAAAAAAVFVLGLDRLPFLLCVFKATTGLPCLTCGSTRALGRLVHLDFAGAVVMNPLAVAGGLLIAAWAVADLGLLARGRALSVRLGPSLARGLRILAWAVVLANWAYLVAAGR
jgi:hypothetical protein